MERPAPGPDDRLARVVAGAVLVVPSMALSFSMGERFLAPKLLAGEGLALLGVLAVKVTRWAGGRREAGWGAATWDLPVIAAVASLLAGSMHPLTGWWDVTRLAGLAAAYWLFRSMDRPWRLAPLVVVAVVANAGLALMQAAGVGLWETTRLGRHAVYGTFGNPNLLAEWLAVAAPVVILAGVGMDRMAGRVIAWVAVALAAAALLACGGRAAVLALVAASPLVALALSNRPRDTGRTRNPVAFGLILGTALMVAAGVWMVRSGPGDPAGSPATDPTTATRALMRDVGWRQWHGHPWLGAGPGAYGAGFVEGAAAVLGGVAQPGVYPGITDEAHCDPVQALAERGIAAAVTWGLALLLTAGLAVWRLRGGAVDRRHAGLPAAALVAAGVIACLSFPFHVFPTACLFLWVIAVLEDQAECASPVSAAAGWYGMVRAVAGAGLLILAGRTLLAEVALGKNSGTALAEGLKLLPSHGGLHFRLGVGLVGQGRLDEAEKEFVAALPGFPDPDVRFNLGWIALQRKDYAGAADRFHEGLRLYPWFKAPAWADYALALAGLKRREEALAAARRALEIDPNLARAQQLVLRLGKKGGR